MSSDTTTSKRGKFLALLASFAMIAVGLLGIATAAPASADDVWVFQPNAQTCSSVSGFTKVDQGTEHNTMSVNAPTGKVFTDLCVKAGDNQHGGGVYVMHLSQPYPSTFVLDHPTKDSISHWGYKVTDKPETRTVYRCNTETGAKDQMTQTKVNGAWTPNGSGWTTNGASLSCGLSRTVFKCNTVTGAKDQMMQTRSGGAWTPEAVGWTENGASLNCGLSRPVYRCNTETGATDQMTQTRSGGAWTPEAVGWTTNAGSLNCGLSRPVFKCNAETGAKDQNTQTRSGGEWTPEYPGWTPNGDSLTCGLSRTVYRCNTETGRTDEMMQTRSGGAWTPDGEGWTEDAPVDCQIPDPCLEDPTAEGCANPDPCVEDPNAEGCTVPETTTYTADATLESSEDICTVNGTVTVEVQGNGLGQSAVSQVDAQGVAKGNAQLDLDYNKRMAKAQFPGATLGECAPVTTTAVEPAVIEAPAEDTALVIAAPEAATIAETPETVLVPAAATVPASVPAGEGSPAPVIPAWALALIALGVLGAAATGLRTLKDNA